jgi:Histidine kinase-, DNA gyrase B-, and HSP90-like ATPase
MFFDKTNSNVVKPAFGVGMRGPPVASTASARHECLLTAAQFTICASDRTASFERPQTGGVFGDPDKSRPSETKHDVEPAYEAYRIAREAVSNAYQHAKAAHIETEVTFSDADLFIRVRDDGIGVDPEVLARGQRRGLWGLPGMRERSASFAGHLHVWSEGNAGTEVELRIPAHVAYAQPGVALSSRLRDFFWPR